MEGKFFELLERLFVGVKLEGDSGYVNLMNIKTDYFKKIREEIRKEIKSEFGNNKPEDLYDMFYSFFDSYFSVAGAIFFSATPVYKNIYAQVYSDRNDTELFWKTRDLYYIKSENLYNSVSGMNIEDNPDIYFNFDASHIKLKQGNEKKELKFYFTGYEKKKKKINIEIKVLYKNDNDYSMLGEKLKVKGKAAVVKYFFENLNKLPKTVELDKTKIDFTLLSHSSKKDKCETEFLIIKENNKFKIIPTISKINEIEKYLKLKHIYIKSGIEKYFKLYQKQNQIDYFIHKDAKTFLKKQYDLYMYQHLSTDSIDTLFDQNTLDKEKKIKKIAYKIIDYIGNFEDELKQIWLKPKFAKNSNYVITLDRIADKNNGLKIIKKLINHKGFNEQINEWQELGIVDKSFVKKNILSKNQLNDKFKFLPIDTKYFKDLEIDIIQLFDDLDNQLDGRLIKSDNFQALNTLLPKYKNKIDLIYIDPPYNAPASEIIYENNYKHSSWLTLMENRLNISKHLMKNNAVFECAIDDNEQEKLGLLLKSIFAGYDKTCVTIVHNPRGVQGNNFSDSHEYTYFIHKKGMNLINKIKRTDVLEEEFKDHGGESLRTDAKNCFYPIIVDKKSMKIIGFGDISFDNYHPSKNVIKEKIIKVYPIDANNIERKWVFARQTVESIADKLFVKKKKDGEIDIFRIKDTMQPKTVWYGEKYDASTFGSKIINNILPNNKFDFPKSIFNVYDCIYAGIGRNINATVLDFFAGSGTSGEVIIRMNKNEKTNKKFILVEMGLHFYNVIIPRLKKICITVNYKKGVPQDNDGNSLFFKYYELEQFEEALRHSCYKPIEKEKLENIDFSFSEKQSTKGLEIDLKKEKAKFVFDRLYDNIDIAETISNLTGRKIKQITKEKVYFENDFVVDINNLDFEKYKFLKELIYW